jgi:hypothetical protein
VKLGRATIWELSQLHYRKRYASEISSQLCYFSETLRRRFSDAFRRAKRQNPEKAAQKKVFLSHSKPKLKVVVFANGDPFEKTARRIAGSLNSFEGLSIDIDLWSLDSIKSRPWFEKIADFPDRKPRPGRRDGFHCAYKPWIILDSMKNSPNGAVNYYVDASQYYKVGFYSNIEPLIDYFWQIGHSKFYGSAMPGFLEAHQNWSAENKDLFLTRMGLNLGPEFFSLPSLLASSMMHVNNKLDYELVEKWAEACTYETVSLNATGEQSVLMAFLASEKKPVLNLSSDPRVRGRGFEISHALGKDHNLVHALFQRQGEGIFREIGSLSHSR